MVCCCCCCLFLFFVCLFVIVFVFTFADVLAGYPKFCGCFGIRGLGRSDCAYTKVKLISKQE